MNGDEYRAALLRCYWLARAICSESFDELRAAQEHAEALGPILDPTLYRDKLQAFREDREVVAALATARAELLKAGFPNKTPRT